MRRVSFCSLHRFSVLSGALFTFFTDAQHIELDESVTRKGNVISLAASAHTTAGDTRLVIEIIKKFIH